MDPFQTFFNKFLENSSIEEEKEIYKSISDFYLTRKENKELFGGLKVIDFVCFSLNHIRAEFTRLKEKLKNIQTTESKKIEMENEEKKIEPTLEIKSPIKPNVKN